MQWRVTCFVRSMIFTNTLKGKVVVTRVRYDDQVNWYFGNSIKLYQYIYFRNNVQRLCERMRPVIVSAAKKFVGYDEKVEPIMFCKVRKFRLLNVKRQLTYFNHFWSINMEFRMNVKSHFFQQLYIASKKKLGKRKMSSSSAIQAKSFRLFSSQNSCLTAT